ncbi:Uncharacterised protein [Mycobacteroides abscessus subsp. abscessus]|uniref:hypothetical protein n=1 Tax=Mycobacteroides abscessus TaxID=36809 RepID=UPI0009A582B4|nr:hypothetical protein [Mycobacteroides abscessus]QSM05008.1 hypothetical protein PROPHIGD12-2_78 [Mycobacterium phage prophiGD12-2]MBN7355485.1 hypothetical protein [Mycobacteroides abscessus subsp. abscessus]MBN7360264.1 hypothetical protein [Mycobacteroides abscessus subsp. abscessus]MBN7474742.1 hypothetical protein [Mycobacteroides abscessus subsp. abscessus]SLI65822.1 Uncharacterised protein [Mycobacteroides abscessus subsp. abscessus]
MTLDQWLELAVSLLAGGVIGTAIKSLVDRWNAKDANSSANWKAFATEQRETFAAAMTEQREAHNAAIGALGGRVQALEDRLTEEQKVLGIALAHLRELRRWIQGGAHGDVPPLPAQLEGRL